jgi:gamma-glutamyltranspeptidase/glutathione hydrolase
VTKDGQPLMSFGNMGGSVQPETHAQHIVNLIDLGTNVQMTTDAARFTHNQTSNGVYRAGSDHRKDRQALGW